MADAAVDINAVNIIVRQAVQGINVNERGQKLKIQGEVEQQQPLTLTDHDVQYFVNVLQRHPGAVDFLVIKHFTLTRQAVEILRAYFATRTMSLRNIQFIGVSLGNTNGGRLLSGLHGNTSVIQLVLCRIGLEFAAGGTVISQLLQHNLCLTQLICFKLQLGRPGARALQVALRANRMVQVFGISNCDLDDDGLSIIVDALQGNTTMKRLFIAGNNITSSNGLPHVTRLLQHQAMRAISLEGTPGLFDNQRRFAHFLIALQSSQVTLLSLNHCQLPGDTMAALFRSLSIKTTQTQLDAYDSVQLRGADLESLLEIIPHMLNVQDLRMNLNFMDKSVLSSFRRNTSIQHLYTRTMTGGTPWQEVVSGPVLDLLKRNRGLCKAIMLLDSEPRRTIPLGLWSKAMGRLGRGNTGATALYKIMREKLVTSWWTSNQEAVTAAAAASSTTIAAPATVASSAVAAAAAPNSAGRRSRGQQDIDDSTRDNMETLSSSSITTTSDPSARKRARKL
jgi:hypothetical protein